METAVVTERESAESTQIWSLAKRSAFRFCFIYLTFYCCASQILTSLFPIPNVDTPDLDTLSPVRSVVFWVGAHVFHCKLPLVYTGSGSGDKTFDWIMLFCMFIAAIAGTVIWSLIDRKRQNYATLYGWFWLFIRFCLAGQMLVYGSVKAVPLQMPRPYLFTLLEPFGNFSPMGVLWSSIGASQPYEIFTGCAELAGAFLLIFPRTAAIGALVALADMTQVFMLNMTYDVPVKLLSFHLILMALFLLGPNMERLASFFLLHRSTESAAPVTLPLTSKRAFRIAAIAQVMLWLWIAGNLAYGDWDVWHQFGPGRQKPPLYGIWDVDQMTVDGQVRPPLLTDTVRWRRMIIDVAEAARIQQMDESQQRYAAEIDEKKNTLSLTKRDDKNWKATFTYIRSAENLQLDGTMAGHKVQLQLKREDETKFLLNSRGFHWVQDYPFNR